MQESWQKYTAEAFATCAFVFIAAGSVLANRETGGELGTLGVALANGLALAAMIYTVWHISGAHLNPAVTIALWATGHVKALQALGYVIAQLVGATVAALFLQVIFSGASQQFYLGDANLGTNVTPGMGILVEAILTFFLTWAVFGAAVDKKAAPGFGGLAVGFVLVVSILVANNITGGALNPARSFGPALITSHWTHHYVYWIGPILGALAAGVIYHFSFLKKRG